MQFFLFIKETKSNMVSTKMWSSTTVFNQLESASRQTHLFSCAFNEWALCYVWLISLYHLSFFYSFYYCFCKYICNNLFAFYLMLFNFYILLLYKCRLVSIRDQLNLLHGSVFMHCFFSWIFNYKYIQLTD